MFKSIVSSIRGVNRKYAKPEIEVTWLVKTCLILLRLYLVVLVGVMIFKFISAVSLGSGSVRGSGADVVAPAGKAEPRVAGPVP